MKFNTNPRTYVEFADPISGKVVPRKFCSIALCNLIHQLYLCTLVEGQVLRELKIQVNTELIQQFLFIKQKTQKQNSKNYIWFTLRTQRNITKIPSSIVVCSITPQCFLILLRIPAFVSRIPNCGIREITVFIKIVTA